MKHGLLTFTVISLLCLLAGCAGGTWSVAGLWDYETFEPQLMYSPDPNGGIGVRAMTDSAVPEETHENLAVGPCLEFYLGDVIANMADRAIPGQWVPFESAPARLYATMAVLWQTQDAEQDFIFRPGTELRLFPDWVLHPAIRTEYQVVEGGSGDEGLRVLFGGSYEFK